jgi:putative Holliday junction resolvase
MRDEPTSSDPGNPPASPLPSRGAVLAIDHGLARIGVAVTDAERRFVLGRDTIARSSDEAALDAIARLCRDESIRVVVVGLPLNADGSEGPAAAAARAFAAKAGARLSLPVVFADERYTTIEADEALRLRHRDWRERRKRIDRAAAALILQTFLDHGPRS